MPSYFDPLWVITSYFNPAKYDSRRRNYDLFRKYVNAPLLTVELTRSGERQLTRDDGDIVVDLVGEDRIWQKERLLNIALAELPSHVEYVAWVDCDVLFEDDDWALKAQRKLSRRGGLLQLFRTAVHLPRDADVRSLSPVSCSRYAPVVSNMSIVRALDASTSAWDDAKGIGAPFEADVTGQYRIADRSMATGMAWAADRAALAASGFYERNIIGGGDSVLAFAALGRLDDYFAVRRLTPAHRDDVRTWAAAAELSTLFSAIGALDNKLYHLWHGTIGNRNYDGRYEILRRHDFDPVCDIRYSSNKTWMWSHPRSALADEVGSYFFSRCEDVPP